MSIAFKKIWIVKGNRIEIDQDQIAVESPLEIILSYPNSNGPKTLTDSWITTMRTPGQDASLIAGLLYTENLIDHYPTITLIKYLDNDENQVIVHLKKINRSLDERSHQMHSSCGICGKKKIEDIAQEIVHIPKLNEPQFTRTILFNLEHTVMKNMEVFQKTGGIHACGLFDTQGNFQILHEDVGRHNALDKIIGTALQMELIPLNTFGCLLSGRASFEMVQKSAMAGIPLIACLGAPSDLAIELAEECGITLIGFLKTKSFNIYTHPERIV